MRRALIASGAKANALAGKIAVLRFAITPLSVMRFQPVDGSQLNFRVKSQMKKIAATKAGIESAAVVNPDNILSKRPQGEFHSDGNTVPDCVSDPLVGDIRLSEIALQGVTHPTPVADDGRIIELKFRTNALDGREIMERFWWQKSSDRIPR